MKDTIVSLKHRSSWGQRVAIDRHHYDAAYHGVATLRGDPGPMVPRPAQGAAARARRRPEPIDTALGGRSTEFCCRDEAAEEQPSRVVRFPDLLRVGPGTQHRLYEGLDPVEGRMLGLFVATCAPAEVTELVELTLALSELDQPCVVRGRVEWVRPWDPDKMESPAGMGIRLERCCEPISAVLKRAFERYPPILFETG